MRRVTVDDFERDPVGCYVAGNTYLHFCATPTLWGLVLWGRPNEDDAIELGRSLVKELPLPAHSSILDASRVTGVDPGAFFAAGRYLARRHDALSRILIRQALIRPAGMDGAVVAGAFDVLPAPYPTRVFADAAAGYAWLVAEGGAPDWPADGPAFVAALHAEASATPALLGGLRALLDHHLAGIALADAAQRLLVSERTLQRKLAELGTTFQDELADARIRVAKRMLVDSDLPVTNIALDVGFASLQHFSAAFRKREQVSPSDYRKRFR